MGIDMEYGIRVVDMVIHHIDMVILDIDMGYGISIWEMTVSIRSSWISIWDILSLCLEVARVRALLVHEARAHVAVWPARAGGSRVDGIRWHDGAFKWTGWVVT
jgi:hypothetical protein